MKVYRWPVSAGVHTVREGAFEVCFGEKDRVNTVCFSGPDASRLSEEFMRELRAVDVADEYDDITDLLG